MVAKSFSAKFWPIYILTFLCLAKFLYLAFFVTPLWDIPDETGHFAYARDIASGDGIPLLGQAKIESDIYSHVKDIENAKPGLNGIAQHPPIYYALAAIPIKAGMAFSLEGESLFKLPRVIAGIAGAISLIVLFQTALLLGAGNYRAMLIAVSVGFIPMFSHLSSGTNHDTTLFLFCALAVHYFIKYVLTRSVRAAFVFAFWLTVAAGVKMTAWVLIPPLILFMALEQDVSSIEWLKRISLIAIVALLTPMLWMARNIYHFSDPFYTASNIAHWRLDSPLDATVLDYLGSNPIVVTFFHHFYGLIGWRGSDGGAVHLLRVSGVPLNGFSISALIFSVIVLVYVINAVTNNGKGGSFCPVEKRCLAGRLDLLSKTPLFYKWVLYSLFFIAAFLSINLYAISLQDISWKIYGLGSFCILVFSSLVSLAVLLRNNDAIQRVSVYLLITFLFFTAILGWQVFEVYRHFGAPKAIHGRYFYPVIPCLVAVFTVSVVKLRVPSFVLALCVTVLAFLEAYAFLFQVLPFYWEA